MYGDYIKGSDAACDRGVVSQATPFNLRDYRRIEDLGGGANRHVQLALTTLTNHIR